MMSIKVPASSSKAAMVLAQKLGISSTPTFLIGRVENGKQLVVTKRINGAKPLEQFASVLDEVIASR